MMTESMGGQQSKCAFKVVRRGREATGGDWKVATLTFSSLSLSSVSHFIVIMPSYRHLRAGSSVAEWRGSVVRDASEKDGGRCKQVFYPCEEKEKRDACNAVIRKEKVASTERERDREWMEYNCLLMAAATGTAVNSRMYEGSEEGRKGVHVIGIQARRERKTTERKKCPKWEKVSIDCMRERSW